MNIKLDTTWNLFYTNFLKTYVYDGVHIYRKSEPTMFLESTTTICLKIKPTVGKAYRASRIAAQILGLEMDDKSRVLTISDDKTDLSRDNLEVVAIGAKRYSIQHNILVDRFNDKPILGHLNPVSGYMQLACYKNGKQNTTYVHRVLWELAHGPIPNGYVVDHIDGDRTNNALSNLQMVSMAHNGHKRRKEQGQYYGITIKQHKLSVSYLTSISHNGHTTILGSFNSILLAAYAYDVAAKFHYGTMPNGAADKLTPDERLLIEAYITPKLIIKPKVKKPTFTYVGVNFAPRNGVVNYNAIITDVDGKTYTMGRYITADDAAYAANKGNEILDKKVRNVLPAGYEPSEAVQIAIDRGIARLVSKKPRKNIQKAA